MVTIYFSGTGNTKYIAELFSRIMGTECLSIEEEANFSMLINSHDTIIFCYPIYGSRVPLIMREFVAAHLTELKGKRIAIFVTQLMFSGDGARVLCDLFPSGHIEVIYAEHFRMPNNICNIALLRMKNSKNIKKRLIRAEKTMENVCRNIKAGIVKKKGFSAVSRLLGKIQGKPWQGDSKNAFAEESSMENRAKHGIKIDNDCTICKVCVEICPMKNLETKNGAISHKNNCTACYRCVNRCPQKAITVLLHNKPKWQYKGIDGKGMNLFICHI